MIACPTVTKSEIRTHYDLATLFYRLLWGRHIHHGLWEGSEGAPAAQQHLINTLSAAARIEPGQRVLDVGCGMGGSSIHLARALNCHVTGVTLSRVQRTWARAASRYSGTAARTDFRCADAEQIDFSPGSFDVVWSIECTEHLFDKPRFVRRAAQWLRPGGRMAICAWLSSDPSEGSPGSEQVRRVCEGFLCPSLGTMSDYVQWMSVAGLTIEHRLEWTARVLRTWEICQERIDRARVRPLARLFNRNMVCFLDRFETILQAYRTGAMQYGCLVAVK